MTNTTEAELQNGITHGWIDPAFIARQLGVAPDQIDTLALLNGTTLRTLSVSPAFDSTAYTERYVDVADSPLHPVIHFLRHGHPEGRYAFPDFQTVVNAITPQKHSIWVESHDLTLTGAPMALLHMLQGLGPKRDHILMAAPLSGPLHDSYTQTIGPVLIHGQSAQRVAGLPQLAAMQKRCSTLLLKAGVRHVLGNSFLAWPMVMAAQHLGLPTSWIIHEPDGQEMQALFPAEVFQAALSLLPAVQNLIFVSDASRKAWGADGNPKAHVIAKALPPAPTLPRPEARAEANCGPEDVLLVSVGTISARKGQADLVAALEHLASHPMANRLKAEFVGYENTPYANDILARLRALRAQGMRVVLRAQTSTMQNRKIVENLFVAADLFIMTSRAESLPLTTAEALAAGCPVISTNGAGIGDMIIPGETGLLYTAGDTQHLAQLIADLAGQPDLVAQMRQAVAARADPQAYPRMMAAYRACLPELFAEMPASASTSDAAGTISQR